MIAVNNNHRGLYGLCKSLAVVVLFMLVGCNAGNPSIVFGKDSCWFCKMTVIDKKFGAVLLNTKGKALTFDSEECLVAFVNADKDFEAHTILVVDYSHPGVLIDAGEAFFIKGGAINSPMGGQLAAFKTITAAAQTQKQTGGNMLRWPAVAKTKF